MTGENSEEEYIQDQARRSEMKALISTKTE